MMLIKNKKMITTGPKYFPAEMCEEEEDETEEDEEKQKKGSIDEPNPKCKCTLIKGQAKTKQYKGYWGSSQQKQQ